MTEEIKTYEFDIVMDTEAEVNLAFRDARSAGLTVKIVTMDGPNGWPLVRVTGKPSLVREEMYELGTDETEENFEEIYRVFDSQLSVVDRQILLLISNGYSADESAISSIHGVGIAFHDTFRRDAHVVEWNNEFRVSTCGSNWRLDAAEKFAAEMADAISLVRQLQSVKGS